MTEPAPLPEMLMVVTWINLTTGRHTSTTTRIEKFVDSEDATRVEVLARDISNQTLNRAVFEEVKEEVANEQESV